MTLSDAIIQQDMASVQRQLRYGDVNAIDEYGFTPLIQAAIVNNTEIAKVLLAAGAASNEHDVSGGTALQWAAENNNLELCQLLLEHRADPNSYNLAGQPVLVMPMLRRQDALRKLLIKYGANQTFARDYINAKLLGHLFEIVGTTNIADPNNEFVEVDFEGFYLEVTLGLVSDTLHQFQNHFAARKLKRYAGLSQFIVQVLARAAELIRYQQYQCDRSRHQQRINTMLEQEPLVIPVGYEGHAITFIKFGNIWAKCDRREDSRLYDNIMFYNITNMHNATPELLQALMYVKQSSEFVNKELDAVLGLEPITELKVNAQISGNCTWANTEATIPALFFLILMQMNRDNQTVAYYKALALNFFSRWREWNKDRVLNIVIQDYHESDSIRKATKAEMLAAVLFQRCSSEDATDRERIKRILDVLVGSPYEYILRNYIRVYYYETNTEEGKYFFDYLKEHGFDVKG